MDNAYMRAEQKRQETERHATRLKEFLIYGADIPEDIQKSRMPEKSAEDLPVQWKRHTKASAAVLRECISKDFTRNFCCSEA